MTGKSKSKSKGGKRMQLQSLYFTADQAAGLRELKNKGRGDIAELAREGVDMLHAFYEGAANLGGQALIDYREAVLARLRGGQ